MKKVVILGGGLSGLAAGEILSKNFKVIILEKENYLGGLASLFEYKGKHIPKYYHHIIKSNKITQKYLKEFGKIDLRNLKWKKIKVFIGLDKKLSAINNLWGLLKFRGLNLYEKFRFGLFGLYTLFLMNPKKISENLSAEKWLNKYAGKGVTKKIFYHLYSKNKFNIPLKDISAKQFAYRLYEKEIYDFFAYPKEGYQKMIIGLKKEIEKGKGIIKIKSKISEINLEKKYVIESGKKIKYDILMSTIPFEEFIKISKGLPKEFKEKVSKIKYCPAVSVCFGTEDFLLKNAYWINFFNERIHILMQHSVLCDNYSEKINWCLRYGGSEEDLKLNDEEIKKEYLKVIKKYFPNVKIKWARVFKTKYGEPIYNKDYYKYVPEHKSKIKGVYFAGIQLTYPKIRNMNVALESGIKVARKILKDFKE